MAYLGSAQNKADKARWQREWRKKNPHLVRDTWNKWETTTNYKKTGDDHRRVTFSMTKEIYDQMLATQNGVCSICKEPPTSINPFVPDHDHSCCPGRKSCGKCVRGLLHRTCNSAIGLLKDDPTILRAAANYLENNHAVALEKAS